MSRIYHPFTLALAASALLAGCGGGGGSDLPEASGMEPELAAQQPPTTDDIASEAGLSAPPSLIAREAAQALSCQPTWDGPRVAAWDMTRSTTAERQALLARFELAVVNMPQDAERTRAFTSGVKKLNAGTQIAQYLNFPDVRHSPASTDYAYDLARQATASGWWLKYGSGTTVAPSSTTWAINSTTWAPANAAGQRYPQFKAKHDHHRYFADNNGIDFAFTANTWARPRVHADWRRNGTDQSRMDASVQSAMRAGYAAYWQSLRALEPSVKVMPGLDNSNDLSSAEYKGVAEGAFLDGMIGKNWSLEALEGWDAMMAHYRAVMANTRGEKAVVFSVYGSSPIDYATLRYGLASALMHDGMFMFIPASGSQVPAWYDEYSAPLGKAVQPPPTAAASNGIWMRKFENGLVLVNPRSTSATINIGSGYQRLAGTQDRTVNNGAQQSSVTLGARQGLIMVKVPAPCEEPAGSTPTPAPTTPTSFATPKVAALDYSRNTTAERKALLSKYDFVILNFTKTMGGQRLQAMATELKSHNPGMKLAQYVAINEAKCEAKPTEDQYAVVTEVNRANWWLRNTAGERVRWSSSYGNCDINIGSYAARNAKGQTYAQFKWEHDYAAWFRDATKVDYVFIDNFWHETRGIPANWKLDGHDLAAKDPQASLIMRKGMAQYVNTVHSVTPRLKVMGNANNDLSMSDYRGLLDGAFIEGLMGKSWSRETWAGWDSMMSLYRGALKNVRQPGNVFFNTFANPTDYKLIRYGLASAMMDNGYFLHIPLTGTMQPSWLDEYGAPIGDPVGEPPTAPAQNGIWRRNYTNGLVLVNPSKTATATINVGSGYKRLKGTQDATVNNGRAESVVTLGPRQGLLMIRQ